MSIRRRIEKLEGGTSGKHSLGWIDARAGETVRDAVERVALSRGLELAQIGHAMVWWPDGSFETFQTVDDPSVLIGWISYEQRLDGLAKLEELEKNRNQ